MNIAAALARAASQNGARPALFHGEVCVADYAEFDRQARRVAAGLRARGVHTGDRVAMFMANHPDWLVGFYGALYAGAAVVPINAKLHGHEADFILRDSGAVICLTDAAHEAALAEVGALCTCMSPSALQDVDIIEDISTRAEGDLAWLFYTSGTTGQPKGVIITHGMLHAMERSYHLDVDQVRAEDAAIYAAPLSHGAGLYNMMHVAAGARHVIPLSGGFTPSEILNLAAHFGNCHMFAAPTMVKRLTDTAIAAGRKGTGLRTVVYAGGPMYTADIETATDHFGAIFVQIYGQGECPMAITALSRSDVVERDHPRWLARLGSVGRAQTGIELRINAPEVGASGEILVRGAAVMPGYWNNPKASQATLQDGWLHTGDIGFLDADGYLTLQDRSKDVIITGGSNVYPREVEEVLLRHPGVNEACVVGAPHADWGEQVIAFVVGDASDAELDALCLSHIARFKRPKRYVRLESLPKNNYGKTLKTALRALLEGETR